MTYVFRVTIQESLGAEDKSMKERFFPYNKHSEISPKMFQLHDGYSISHTHVNTVYEKTASISPNQLSPVSI